MPECGQSVSCETCRKWIAFLPTLRVPAKDHEANVRSAVLSMGEDYIPPPPIPSNPCLDVQADLRLARDGGIIS